MNVIQILKTNRGVTLHRVAGESSLVACSLRVAPSLSGKGSSAAANAYSAHAASERRVECRCANEWIFCERVEQLFAVSRKSMKTPGARIASHRIFEFYEGGRKSGVAILSPVADRDYVLEQVLRLM